MADTTVRTLSGAALTEEAIQGFGSKLRGELLRPGDSNYDDARKVYNGMIDKRPGLIARCVGVADVIDAVNFARNNNLVVSVRGGGHNVAGTSLCDGGLVIDLSRMNAVRVDPEHRTARAEGGATWGDLDRESQAFGLATTGGIFPTTGVGGLTQGGGIGYLNRKYGLACDNLVSADVVTADGKVVPASMSQNEDLFWALRGGGGNFGVVTSLEYRLHPVGPVLGGMLIWPLALAKEVLPFHRDWARKTPDEMRSDAVLLRNPEGEPCLAALVCWCGDIGEGERVLTPLREFRPPVVDTVASIPYKTVQDMLAPAYPPGLLQYWKSSFLRDYSNEAIGTMVDLFPSAPSPMTAIALEHVGGAISRVGAQETAYSHRGAEFSFLIFSVWTIPGETQRNIEWSRKYWDAVALYLEEGVYVNYLGEGEGEARVRAAYGVNYDRLRTVKGKYDPGNLFRSNQNIRPAG